MAAPSERFFGWSEALPRRLATEYREVALSL
jgi:hypothetical protein